MPKRIQMTRQHPWRVDSPDAVIVSRPGPLGNPFRIGEWYTPGATGPDPHIYLWGVSERVRDRAHAVDLFREWQHHRRNYRYNPFSDAALGALAGRDLACWCPLDQPCHADVLLNLANRPEAA